MRQCPLPAKSFDSPDLSIAKRSERTTFKNANIYLFIFGYYRYVVRKNRQGLFGVFFAVLVSEIFHRNMPVNTNKCLALIG